MKPKHWEWERWDTLALLLSVALVASVALPLGNWSAILAPVGGALFGSYFGTRAMYWFGWFGLYE